MNTVRINEAPDVLHARLAGAVCHDCRFSVPVEDHRECRLNAPTQIRSRHDRKPNDPTPWGEWPLVTGNDWCGHFERVPS